MVVKGYKEKKVTYHQVVVKAYEVAEAIADKTGLHVRMRIKDVSIEQGSALGDKLYVRASWEILPPKGNEYYQYASSPNFSQEYYSLVKQLVAMHFYGCDKVNFNNTGAIFFI